MQTLIRIIEVSDLVLLPLLVISFKKCTRHFCKFYKSVLGIQRHFCAILVIDNHFYYLMSCTGVPLIEVKTCTVDVQILTTPSSE